MILKVKKSFLIIALSMLGALFASEGQREGTRNLFRCDRCELTYNYRSYLNRHLKSKAHAEAAGGIASTYLLPGYPYKCDVCKVGFLCKIYLKDHQQKLKHIRAAQRHEREKREIINEIIDDLKKAAAETAEKTAAIAAIVNELKSEHSGI